MNLLTMPYAMLQQLLGGRHRRGGAAHLAIGESHWVGNRELLVRSQGGAQDGPFLAVSLSDELTLPKVLATGCAGAVVFGHDRRRGRWHGVVGGAAGLEPIDRLKLIGPGMHILRRHGPRLWAPAQADLPSEANPSSPAGQRWSRTIGALGGDVVRRLRRLHYGVNGLGRTGSDVALSLRGAWGAGRLTLIDPDVAELYNLGEAVGLGPEDMGALKVQAVLRRLAAAPVPVAVRDQRSLGLGGPGAGAPAFGNAEGPLTVFAKTFPAGPGHSPREPVQ